MKYNKFLNLTLAVGSLLLVSSCTSEEPFQQEADNLVRMNVSINSALTRSVEGETLQSLLDNCVIYISDKGGLLHKWVGVNNIPPQGVYLKYGDYVAEAWSGDSVGASFSKKFFKGLTNFNVGQQTLTTQVTVNCKLANVVASVDVSSFPAHLVDNLEITFSNSDGSLEFNSSNFSEKGYFMRPFNKETGFYDTKLNYFITGTDIDGSVYEKQGEISNVLPAHEYRLYVENDPTNDSYGGVNLKLTVKEYELEVDDEVVIYGNPEFEWEGNKFDIKGQIAKNSDGQFEECALLVGACDGFRSLKLSSDNEEIISQLAGNSVVEIVGISESAKDNLKNKGLEILYCISDKRIKGYKFKFSPIWFESLSESPEEFIMNVEAVDIKGKTNRMNVRIVTSDEALDAPFSLDTNLWKDDLLAVGTLSARIHVNMRDDNVSGLEVQYREKETTEWLSVIEPADKKTTYWEYELKNLKPLTTYECRVVGGEKTENGYQYISETGTFTTEGKFEIPNASMEEWNQIGKAWYPMPVGQSFWDSGNKGSTTLSQDDNLTIKFTDFFHKGEACAKLTSKYVGVDLGLLGKIGKHGAASLLTGEFSGTEQTTHGIVNLGREYDKSHPKALRVWVNYRPGIADKGADDAYIKKGDPDIGQIYIALSTKIHTARTFVPSTLVNENNPPEEFIAYNQYTFEGSYGDENTLKELIIPFVYFEKAHTLEPQYLIIVCAASKYGDYFSGGEGSTMYVDDFELIYE